MSSDLVYLLGGVSLLLAVVLPTVLRRAALSAPMVLVGCRCADRAAAPAGARPRSTRREHRAVIEHVTEVTVLVALMGVGLALDRPLRCATGRWRRWSPTWRLLGIAMPLTIGGVALLGWGGSGIAPAAALLLGAALAPTDPVLASDVQVEGPERRGRRRGDRRGGRGALRPDLARPGSTTGWPSPSSTPRCSSRRHGRGVAVGPALGGLGAGRQDVDRGRWSASPSAGCWARHRVPLAGAVAAGRRDRRAAAGARGAAARLRGRRGRRRLRLPGGLRVRHDRSGRPSATTTTTR